VRAPIGLSVYRRLDHLRQTLTALRENTLAAESPLYVFSDAPRPGDEQAVSEVRRYLETVDGFLSVEIIERHENSRVANNRGGQRLLLDTFGEMIWLEEDIVTAPRFLEFMNAALEYYRVKDGVVSVTGYSPPLGLPRDYDGDVYFLQRFNAWGFAIWKDRYDRIELNIEPADYRMRMRDREFYRRLVGNGPDIPRMLDKEVSGEIDALDVKIMYQQIVHGWYTVYPRQSLVQNIGHDGSGMHCVATGKFHHDELWLKKGDFHFLADIHADERIVTRNMKFRDPGRLAALAERIRHIRRRIA